jgi:DNA modification methylase
METEHRVVVDDSRDMAALDGDSVELVVTSPPYPMIEMWDDVFEALDPAVADHLDSGDGEAAFEAMHAVLDDVWAEVSRVLVDGGIACVNVGDATRSVDGSFRVFQNHSRVIDAFADLGFEPLPEILWRKPVNSAAKFMGSGMLPPNAYVTLEHEYVLVFRNGPESRSFEPHADERYEAAYFWEERNRWFSDVWRDVRGERQVLENGALRERSAAYPFDVPYRLVNMYSTYGDTVLDPFWGTGTTSLAAVVAGRNSIGYEREREFVDVFHDRVADAPALSRRVIGDRLDAHREFVRAERPDGSDFAYDATHYDVPVRTKQERDFRFYAVDDVTATDDGYRVRHAPVDEIGDVDVGVDARDDDREPGSTDP